MWDWFRLLWNWKNTAWAVWRSMSQLRPTFLRLSRAPTQISPHEMEQIERCVVLLYQRTSALSHVNEARKQLFTHNRKMENIHPTLHALEQHVKRAVFQAGHIWGTVIYRRAQCSITRFMGLGESERWFSMDSMLDHSSRGSQMMSRTVKMWM